jgi:N utilization substance protein A
MNKQILEVVEAVSNEKGVAREIIFEALEAALASATRRKHGEDIDVRVEIDRKSGEYKTFRRWKVFADDSSELEFTERELRFDDAKDVDAKAEIGGFVEVPMESVAFGRIAAQTAKQVIYQKLRDAEREMTYEEFSGREGDIVTGIIQQDSHRYTLLDLGKVEALLPQAEQVPSEPYRHGERLKAYIVEVRRTTKGPQIVVSRTHPGLLRRLFQLEVPEIDQGIVEIKAVAREPGHRSKIAVTSHEPGVDPVGACVGPKGSRVRMVVNELRGEKIDVVQWIDDSERFVANALAPAKVKEVHVDPATGSAKVIVPDYQLSLAIGKEGQNARLAAKLTGYRIDIKSETQSAEEDRVKRERKAKEPESGEAPATATVPDSEPAILSQAGEAPEVEIAAPGDGSVPPDPEPAEPEASASA